LAQGSSVNEVVCQLVTAEPPTGSDAGTYGA